MNKLFKSRRKRIRNLLLAIMPFVILIGVFSFLAYKSLSTMVGNSTGVTVTASSPKNVIESMNYSLRENATEYQKELFEELSELVKDGTDKEAIAGSVVKNYVADFYTWTNKNGSYDVGGLCYVHSESKSNLFVKARNTFYKHVTFYINELGNENLLEAVDIQVEGGLSNSKYELNGKEYDSYFFTCWWDYKNEDKLADATKGLLKKQHFNVIERENGRFEIVEVFGDE